MRLAMEESGANSYYDLLKQASQIHSNTLKRVDDSLAELIETEEKCSQVFTNFSDMRQVLLAIQEQYCT